jgi:hypothetical protein
LICKHDVIFLLLPGSLVAMEFLNGQFERDDIFFGEIVKLLSDFSWIYKSRNTDILADGILNCIPNSWIPIFQLNFLDNIQMAIKGETKVISNATQSLKK